MAAVFSPVSSLYLLPGAMVLALQTSSSMTRKLVQLSLTQEARKSPREDTDWPVWVTCPPLKSSLRPAPDGHLWLSSLIYGPPKSTTHVRLFSSPARFLSQVLSQPLQVSLLPTYFVQLLSLPVFLSTAPSSPLKPTQASFPVHWLCSSMPMSAHLHPINPPRPVHMSPPPGSLPQHPFRTLPSQRPHSP